jgi:type IV secretion system protein VirB8
VRFQRNLYDKLTGVTQPMNSEIATMTFEYKANLKMDDQYRVINPLGFQVTDYRVDSDASTAVPDAVPGSPVAQPASASSVRPASTATAPQTNPPSLPLQPPMPEHEAPNAVAPTAAPVTNNTANGVGHR